MLVFNSRYFLDELIAQANKVKDNEKSAIIENRDALVALAKIDWSTAEPLIRTLITSGQQRTSAFALTLLYRHSLDEKDTDGELSYRKQLQSIAADRSLPGRARNEAMEALSSTEWTGRDDWYLSILADESLIRLSDGSYGFLPLTTLFDREAEKWIPVMTKLVAGKDRVLQQSAGSCLVRYGLNRPRRDVLLPLIRWLTEPDWIPTYSSDRVHLIQTMDQIDIPESVPGLIWIVENDKDNRQWAARSLARYKDPRAIPALKKALAEVNEEQRVFMLEGLVASGGLTEAEQVSALETYAAKLATISSEEERYQLLYGDKNLPIELSIGKYLANLKSPSDDVVQAVIARTASLRKQNEVLSKSLLQVAHGWQGRQVDRDLIKRIAANTADANTIITALERRTDLRKTVETEMRLLLAVGGAPQAIGAILLEENEIAGSILSSNDEPAKIAVLACARLTQTPLPITVIEPLLKSKNALLAMAAERYLLAEDSKEARTLLWQHRPNEAFITGWRENIQLMAGGNFDQIGKLEEKLREELLKPDGPVEIFALLANHQSYSRVLRIYRDKAIYINYEDPSRYREAVVLKGGITDFKQSISNSGLWDFGPQFSSCHHDCWVSELLMLTREKGRRVFSHQGFQGNWYVVAENFERLELGGARTRYEFENDIKGVDVLYEGETLQVQDVWQKGDDIRIFVEHRQDDGPALLSWRKLKGTDAGSVTTAPEGYSTFDDTRFPYDEEEGRRDDRQVQVLTPDSILIAKNFQGLWKQVAGTKAVRISEGFYLNPIVTPDGKWAVIAKTDDNWGDPNYIVRFSLETGREFRVNVEPADDLDPVIYLPLHGKTLLRRAKTDFPRSTAKSVGPDKPEYYLLDPKTGLVQAVSGEFRPLRQEGKRFLQPTGNPNEYWAAIPDETKDETQVGRYNLKDFSFKAVLTVPRISFESMSMWVDEQQGKLYLVYKEQLLRLPLSK